MRPKGGLFRRTNVEWVTGANEDGSKRGMIHVGAEVHEDAYIPPSVVVTFGAVVKKYDVLQPGSIVTPQGTIRFTP